MLFFLAEQQPALGRVEQGLAHRDVGVGLDLGALFLVDRDDLGQAPHPDRIEGVVLVERGERGLVEARQRDRVEQDAVLRQVVAQQPGDLGDELGALFVQRVHLLARRDRLHRIDETTFEHVANAVGREGLGAERLRRGGHTFDRRLHAHVKLKLGVDAHPVFGDQRFFAGAPHLDADRAHADLVDLVQEGQREEPARDHRLLAAEAGADDRHVTRRLAVEAVQEHHHDRDHDDGDDDSEEPGEHDHVGSRSEFGTMNPGAPETRRFSGSSTTGKRRQSRRIADLFANRVCRRLLSKSMTLLALETKTGALPRGFRSV